MKKFQPQFPGHDEGEKIKAIMRRHWIRLFRHALWFILETLIPVAAAVLLLLFTQIRLETESLPYVVAILGISLYYLYILLFFFADLVDYHLDIWVITDKRLVSIEQKGMFNRVVAEQPILKVQDVTHEVHGKLQTLMDFGNVHIQTAGEKERFIFAEVPHPDRVAKLILKTHDEAIQAHDQRRVEMYHTQTPTKPPLTPDSPQQESHL